MTLTTHIVEDNQWTVDASDGVVSYPGRHRDHAGVHNFRHRGGSERFGEVQVSLGVGSRAAVGL